jgi:hypothetical protein
MAEYHKGLGEHGAGCYTYEREWVYTFALVSGRGAAERLADRFQERFGSDFWVAIAEREPTGIPCRSVG